MKMIQQLFDGRWRARMKKEASSMRNCTLAFFIQRMKIIAQCIQVVVQVTLLQDLVVSKLSKV